MGVCVSGIEGLGTPPAPPAEEALTAEHRGLIPPSLPPSILLRPVPHSCWPPSSSHTFSISSLSLVFYLFPVVPHISARPRDAHNICSYFHIYVCPRLCLLSSHLSFSPPSFTSFQLPLFKSLHYLSLIIYCSAGAGHIQRLLTVTATSTVCFLLVAGDVSPLSTFLFILKTSAQKPHYFQKYCRLYHQFARISCRTLSYVSGWFLKILKHWKRCEFCVHLVLAKLSERCKEANSCRITGLQE